jgi:hypothetical protein
VNRQSALARFKKMPHSDYWIDYELQHGATAECGLKPAELYGRSLCKQGFSLSVALSLYKTSAYAGDMEAFMTGFNGFKPCTHFVGFRSDSEFWSAVGVWGRPDFYHRHWDKRVPGDVAPGDTVIFARGTDRDPFVPYTFDDSAVFADENKFG